MKKNSVAFFSVKIQILQILFALSLNHPVAAQIPISTTDSLALVALYNATDGSHWTKKDNWLTGPVSSWWGIITYGCNVTTIEMIIDGSKNIGNNLSGTIPKEIGNLNHLAQLSLSFNKLTGNIPKEIGNLTDLQHLGLGWNNLTGSIPPEIGQLMELKSLGLERNQLSGEIPAEIYDLVHLRWFELWDNLLTGSISPKIGNLTNLENFSVYSNQFTGEIPVEIGNLTNLNWLDIGNNQLTGKIPSSIKNLIKLKGFHLYNNKLSGNIPNELEQLSSLTDIGLFRNQLSGTIPSNLLNLPNLALISLGYNKLSGSLPERNASLSSLKGIQIEENLINEIPFLRADNNLYCYNNNLTFEDFERNLVVMRNKIIDFQYSPQHDFGSEYYTTAFEGKPFTLSIPCGGVYNHYKWFKNGVLIPAAPDTSQLTFPSFQPSDAGYYHITVSNDSVQNLTLQSYPVHINLLSAPTLSSPNNNSNKQPLTLLLIWNNSSWSESYTLQVSTFPDFSNTVVNQSGLTTTSYSVNDLENSTKYYWRVKGTNVSGTSGWSLVWSFTTLQALPEELKPVNLVIIDGMHSPIFMVEGLEFFPENNLVVFSKRGNKVFESSGYKNDLDFSNYPAGTYFYILNVNMTNGSKQYKSFVNVVKK